MASLLKWFQDAANNVGQAIDNVVPGNQSALHRPQAPQRPVQAPPAMLQRPQVQQVQAPQFHMPNLGNIANQVNAVKLPGLGNYSVGNAYHDFAQPIVTSAQNVGHGVNAAGMAAASVAQGHKGAQLAQDKKNIIAEFNKSGAGKATHLLDTNKVTQNGKYTGSIKMSPEQMRALAGNALTDATNLGSLINPTKQVAEGAAAKFGVPEMINLAKTQGGKQLAKTMAKNTGKVVAENAINNAIPSVTAGVGSALSDPNLHGMDLMKQMAINSAVNEGLGTALGVGAHGAGKAVGEGIRGAKYVANDPVLRNEAGFIAGSGAKDFAKNQAKGKTFIDPADNLPKFEVSDHKASVRNGGLKELNNKGETTLGNLINHKELFKQYGKGNDTFDARSVRVTADSNLPPARHGQYDPATNTITLNPELLRTKDDILNSIVHENQHGVDVHEGVFGGTNPEQAGGFDNYLKDIGEQRARDQAARRTMTPAERAANPSIAQAGPDPAQALGYLQRDKVAQAIQDTGALTANHPSVGVEKPSHIMANDTGTAADALHGMVSEYADHLRQLHKDTGGTGMLRDDSDTGGATYKRFSTNDSFYRDYYKANGKAPNKAAWIEEAKRQLEKGNDDYSQAYQATKMMLDAVPEAPKPATKPVLATTKTAVPKQVEAPKPTPVKATTKPTLPEVPKKQEVKPPTPIDTAKYVKQQVKAQEAARKGETASVKGKAKSFISEVKTKLIDSNAPIEDILDSVMKSGTDIKPTNNLKYQIDKTLRAPVLATQFARDHGLVDAIVDAKNVDEFNQYLIARHAQDLTAKEIKTGRNAEADAKLLKEMAPKYEALAREVNSYSQKLLDYAAEKGLVSKAVAKQLKEEYPNYVPMNRIFSDSEQQAFKGNGRGPASLSSQSVVQRLKGSERQVENPLESLLVKTQDAFKQGELNDSARMLASYKDLPGNPFSLRELKKDETVGLKHTISFLDNGKKRVFETTPEIANAAKSLNKEQLGLVGKILSVPTRVLRLGATGVNLPFVASNIVRDQVTAFINSDKALATSVANPANFLRAMFNAVGHGKEYENMLRNGAGGTSFDVGRDAAKDTIKRIRAERHVSSRILYTVTRPAELLRFMEDTVGRSEELGRIQQFTGTRDAHLKQGKSLDDANILAAHAARNNSTNFARSGDYGRVLNAVLPYLNAGVQGSRTFVRNAQTRPVQTAAKVALTTFMPVAAVTAWNLSDPKRKEAYDNIQEYEKGGNIIIVPPNPTQDDKGRWNVIKIPMSQEIANLADVVRNGVEAASKDKAFDVAKMAGNLLGTVSSLNVGEPRQLVGQLIPQALKPAIEGMTNTNLFTGNQIVSQGLQNYPAGMQYKPNTSGTAVQIGKKIGVSPLYIQNAIGTAAGGVGNQLLNASDRMLVKAGVTKPSQVAGQDALDNTLSKFSKAKGTSADQLKYQQEDAAKKAKAAAGAPKALAEAGLEGNGSMKGVDPKAQTRIDTAKKTFASGLSKQANTTLTNYAKLDTKGKSDYNNDPAKVYQLHLAQYENDKANGKFNQIEDYKKLQSLGKEAVTSKYSQEVQQFYGMSKAQQSAYFATDRAKATDLYEQAKQLDAELGAKKFATGTKYKYGLGTKGKTAKAKSTKFKLPKTNASLAIRSSSAMNKLMGNAHVKPVKVPHAPKLAKAKPPKIPKTRTITTA